MTDARPAGPHVVSAYGTIACASVMQGLWTERQYLAITHGCNHFIEFTDGCIEILPMPTRRHQAISGELFIALMEWTKQHGGEALFGPLCVQLRQGKMRQPDLLLVLDSRDPRMQDAFWLGADLVMEIVSPDNPSRDLVTKRNDYAEAGIPEYWIVNPLTTTITVLTLHGDAYQEHGVFGRGEKAEGIVLPGFSADVSETFDAGELPQRNR